MSLNLAQVAFSAELWEAARHQIHREHPPTRMASPWPLRRPNFLDGTRASVAVQSAMLMLLALGFVALGVEASQLLLEHRKQQTVADSAAIAAAAAVKLGVTDLQTEARAVAAQQGYRDGVGGITVTAVNPPASGPHANDVKYVEVKVSTTTTPALMQMFRRGAVTVRARAVASIGASGSTVCALLLEPSAADALKLDNNPTLSLPDCAITVNSTSTQAVTMYNSSEIEGAVNVAGNVKNYNSSSITGTVTQGAAPGTDPYASVVPETPTKELDVPPLQNNSKITLEAGLYKNGWSFNNTQEITLRPGTYFVRNGFSLSNSAKVIGTSGVTIVLDGNFTIGMNNSTTLNLVARNDSATAGIAIYGKQSTGTQQFTNSNALTVTGAIYLPNATVQLNSSATNGSTACTQLIARKLYMTNSAQLTLKGSCSGVGTSSLGASGPTALAE